MATTPTNTSSKPRSFAGSRRAGSFRDQGISTKLRTAKSAPGDEHAGGGMWATSLGSGAPKVTPAKAGSAPGPATSGATRTPPTMTPADRLLALGDYADAEEIASLSCYDRSRYTVGVWMLSVPMEVFIVLTVVVYMALVVIEMSLEEEVHEEWDAELTQADLVLLLIMSVEIVAKFYAFGFSYLKNGWNLFDAIVIVVSLVLNIASRFDNTTGLLRVLRLRVILRMFRLVIVWNRMKASAVMVRKLRARHGEHVSPLERTMMALHELSDLPTLSQKHKDNIEYVLEVITSHRLYTAGDVIAETQNNGNAVDDETQEWLAAQYLNPEAGRLNKRVGSRRNLRTLEAEREADEAKRVEHASRARGASHGPGGLNLDGLAKHVSDESGEGKAVPGRTATPGAGESRRESKSSGDRRASDSSIKSAMSGVSQASVAAVEQQRMKQRMSIMLQQDLTEELSRMDDERRRGSDGMKTAHDASHAASMHDDSLSLSDAGTTVTPKRKHSRRISDLSADPEFNLAAEKSPLLTGTPGGDEDKGTPAGAMTPIPFDTVGVSEASVGGDGGGASGGAASTADVIADAHSRLTSGQSKGNAMHMLKTSSRLKLFSERAVKTQRLLARVDQWDFDVFQAADATGGFPLFLVAYNLMHLHNTVVPLELDESILRRVLFRVEAGYKNLPYHNSTHAADVTQTLCYFISKPFLLPFVTHLEKLAAILAAAVHDYGHPGLNNAFHVNAAWDLAIIYNDRAVLENMHVSSFFQIMREPGMDLFDKVDKDDRKTLRSTIISMVLATDMAVHFDEVAKFKSKLLQVHRKRPEGDEDYIRTAADTDLFLRMALHTADVSNPAKPIYLAKRWTDRVAEEFYNQGDMEREKGFPISAFMDRKTGNKPKLQLGFISFIVRPLFEQWATVMPEVEKEVVPILNMVTAHWNEEKAKDEAAAAEAAAAEGAGDSVAVTIKPDSGDKDGGGGGKDDGGGQAAGSGAAGGPTPDTTPRRGSRLEAIKGTSGGVGVRRTSAKSDRGNAPGAS